MVPAVNGRIIVYVRAVLSALTLILTVATIVPGYISMLEFQGNVSSFPLRASIRRDIDSVPCRQRLQEMVADRRWLGMARC